MTIFRSKKRTLVTSVIALFVCILMLLGATYAWFTDSAVSPDNQINTGNLDVQLYHWTAADASTNISDSNTPVFSNDIIWESGMTQVVYLSVKNAGTLALKYKLDIVITDVTTGTNYNLADVMEYSITKDAKYGDVTEWVSGNKFENSPGTNATEIVDVELAKGEEHFYAISIHMLEDAGNAYMNKSIAFDINVLAGQTTEESDSFGNTYDELAGYPGTGYATAITGEASAAEIRIVGKDGSKVGSVVIPKDAADPDATVYTANITESTYEGNFTVDAGMEVTKYDVSVEGLVADNTTPVKVQLRIAAGLDPDTVKLYHYDEEIACTYDPHTGYVTFETTSFSPFTIVYDADSEFVLPALPEGATTPVADVKYEEQYVNTELPWGSYGQWSPTEGLDANLEAAFTFACPDYDNLSDADKAIIDAYRYWYCDFYVSLDRDLGANQIFLGGNYGSFGWVGFHNGDLTLPANEEIGLLSSVTTNPWTYDNVESSVGTFICGVGDVDDALEGATFTVKLRLTNPEDANEYYDVNVVTYQFGGDYTIVK